MLMESRLATSISQIGAAERLQPSRRQQALFDSEIYVLIQDDERQILQNAEHGMHDLS